MSDVEKIIKKRMQQLGNQFFQPIPSDVVRFWQDGKYSGGLQRSVEYDRIGWALMLRGIYMYETKDHHGVAEPEPTHRGFGIFDLYDGELRCYGIRVWTGADWDPLQKIQHPLLWRSDVCAIQLDSVENQARLRCVYRLLCPIENFDREPKSGSYEESVKVFRDCWQGESMSPKDNSAIHAAETGTAVSYLTKCFERDWGAMRKRATDHANDVKEKVSTKLESDPCLKSDDNCKAIDDILVSHFRQIIKEPGKFEIDRYHNLVRDAIVSADDQIEIGKLKELSKQVLPALRLKEESTEIDVLEYLLSDFTDEALVASRFRRHLAALWKAIPATVVAGFTLDLRPYETGDTVSFDGEYGAFGRPAVGGKITFTRLDAESFNR